MIGDWDSGFSVPASLSCRLYAAGKKDKNTSLPSGGVSRGSSSRRAAAKRLHCTSLVLSPPSFHVHWSTNMSSSKPYPFLKTEGMQGRVPDMSCLHRFQHMKWMNELLETRSENHSPSLRGHRQKDEPGTAERVQMHITNKDRVRLESSPALDFRLPPESGETGFQNWEPALRGDE